MRFLADMGISLRVAKWLREQGHDVLHLCDERLQRLADSDIFAKAERENRLILTFDLDFAEILALSGNQTVSTIIFRLKNTRTSFVIERLAQVLHTSSKALQQGAIIIVQDSHHRVRGLPVGCGHNHNP